MEIEVDIDKEEVHIDRDNIGGLFNNAIKFGERAIRALDKRKMEVSKQMDQIRSFERQNKRIQMTIDLGGGEGAKFRTQQQLIKKRVLEIITGLRAFLNVVI